MWDELSLTALADLVKAAHAHNVDDTARRAIAAIFRGGTVDGYPECSHCDRQVPSTDPGTLVRMGWHASGLEAPTKPNDSSWTCDPCWQRLADAGELPGA